MRIILVRHGETQENLENVIQGHLPGRLSEKGEEQVEKLGRRLRSDRIDHIYSSDLDRARRTAEAILRHLPDVPVTYTAELRERYLGRYQGMRGSDIDWDELARSTDIETPADMTARARGILRTVGQRHPGGAVVLVGHGGINFAILSVIVGEATQRLKTTVAMDNASVSIFEGDGELRPLLLNSTEHLI